MKYPCKWKRVDWLNKDSTSMQRDKNCYRDLRFSKLATFLLFSDVLEAPLNIEVATYQKNIPDSNEIWKDLFSLRKDAISIV